MSDTIELRPCPFCGQPVTYQGNRFVCGGCGNPNWYFEPENEAKAIAEWNTRPIEDALRARVASLERIIIEADACYNMDRKPGDIEMAELSLVQMCGYGREAMDKEAEMRAENAALKVEYAKVKRMVDWALKPETQIELQKEFERQEWLIAMAESEAAQ